jgi:hypothetical protein
MSLPNTLTVSNIVGVSAIAAVFGLLLTVFRGVKIRGEQTRQFQNARMTTVLLLAYANEHEANFPKKLEDLPLDGMPPDGLHFHDPKTKQVRNWLYYGGYKYEQQPSQHTIILASPVRIDSDNRVAIYSDGKADYLKEDEFARLLAEQLNRK